MKIELNPWSAAPMMPTSILRWQPKRKGSAFQYFFEGLLNGMEQKNTINIQVSEPSSLIFVAHFPEKVAMA
jgi:hypothetical protein